jgi:hypothetical protein
MVPDDQNEIPAAIESALGKLARRINSDRASVATNRTVPVATRDAGVAAIAAMDERAGALLETLNGRTAADSTDRSVT